MINSLAASLPASGRPSPTEHLKRTDGTNSSGKSEELVVESMNESNQSSKRPGDRDDLQEIKGIGQATAQALYDLGIHRYADLAGFTPESLAERLKAKVPSISPKRIESADWLGQARDLADKQREPQASQGDVTDLSAASDEAPSEAVHEVQVEKMGRAVDEEFAQSEINEAGPAAIEDAELVERRPPRENWRELADFFVSFGYALGPGGEERLQTKIHYSQAEEDEQWDGIALEQLAAWISSQADLPQSQPVEAPGEAEPPVEPVPAPQAAEEVALLELSELWVSEVTVPAPVGSGQHSALRADSRLELSGPAANDLTGKRPDFTVELYLINTETNQSRLAASYPGQLKPGQLIYQIQQDFPIPSTVGRYQLYLVARLLPPHQGVAHLQGPLVRVET